MRLFGKVDSAINRYDRAVWVTGGPWGGFDLSLLQPQTASLTALGVFSVPRFSGQVVSLRSMGGQVLTQPRFSGQVVTER